jgi:hypothetical protein
MWLRKRFSGAFLEKDSERGNESFDHMRYVSI